MLKFFKALLSLPSVSPNEIICYGGVFTALINIPHQVCQEVNENGMRCAKKGQKWPLIILVLQKVWPDPPI